MIKLNPCVTALETSIGLYINGEVPIVKYQTAAEKSIAMMTRTHKITALWELDILGIKDTMEKESSEEHDRQVKVNFQRNLRKADDGRYIVKLPWISESIKIPTNKNVAEKRLQTTTNKLVVSNEFENYDDIFRAWEEEGILEIVDIVENNPEGHYLPHRPVLKPEYLTSLY